MQQSTLTQGSCNLIGAEWTLKSKTQSLQQLYHHQACPLPSEVTL